MDTKKSARLIYRALIDSKIDLAQTHEDVVVRVIEAHLPTVRDCDIFELIILLLKMIVWMDILELLFYDKNIKCLILCDLNWTNKLSMMLFFFLFLKLIMNVHWLLPLTTTDLSYLFC